MVREFHGGKDAGGGNPRPTKYFYHGPAFVPSMRIALTGTPGTGKSSVGDILRSRGILVVEVSDIAREAGLFRERDEERGSYELDPEELQTVVDSRLGDGTIVMIGHMSHLVRHDLCIVLRCRPSVLRERLRTRGWPHSKVQENVEAEAVDVILIEAMGEDRPVFEIDTTDRCAEMVAEAVQEIMAGKIEKYRPGHTDWSEEVLEWF